jgi:hypothetical protein
MIAATPAQPALCRGADLAGSFAAISGSAGAGNVGYRLRLSKHTRGSCFVSGIPQLRLLDRSREPLPTHATAAHPGRLTAVRVVLARGESTRLAARFSPDVPPGCGGRAWYLRVWPGGGGSVVVPVRPPTVVCQRGRLQLDAFTR